jgi:hypothetical protein
VRKLWWVITILGGIVASLFFAIAVASDSAPKEAAGAALALGWVVIPYCIARACTEIVAINAQSKRSEPEGGTDQV